MKYIVQGEYSGYALVREHFSIDIDMEVEAESEYMAKQIAINKAMDKHGPTCDDVEDDWDELTIIAIDEDGQELPSPRDGELLMRALGIPTLFELEVLP